MLMLQAPSSNSKINQGGVILTKSSSTFSSTSPFLPPTSLKSGYAHTVSNNNNNNNNLNPYDQEFIDSLTSLNFQSDNQQLLPLATSSRMSTINTTSIQNSFNNNISNNINNLGNNNNNNSFFNHNNNNLSISRNHSPDLEINSINNKNKLNFQNDNQQHSNQFKLVCNTKIQYSNSTFIPSNNKFNNNNNFKNNNNNLNCSNNSKDDIDKFQKPISSSLNIVQHQSSNINILNSFNNYIKETGTITDNNSIYNNFISPDCNSNSPNYPSTVEDLLNDSGFGFKSSSNQFTPLVHTQPPYKLKPIQPNIIVPSTPNISNNISTTHTTSTSQSTNNSTSKVSIDQKSIQQLIQELVLNEKREEILNEIVKRKDSISNLSTLLWFTPSVISIFIQEIIMVYKYISNPNPKLKARASNRVSNTLILLQLITSDSKTRDLFFKSKLVLYLVPFLKTTSKSKPFEYLRLSTLNVISSLIKSASKEVVVFLIDNEVFLPCLKIMEMGGELSKTVATFVIQKILNEDVGLSYFIQSPEKLSILLSSLKSMVSDMAADHMSSRLLKHIVRCYLRLSDDFKVRDQLPNYLHQCFSNGILSDFIQKEGDVIVKRWFSQLMNSLKFNDPKKKR